MKYLYLVFPCKVFSGSKTANGLLRLYNLSRSDRKTFMIWVHENVPPKFKSYVRNKYFGIENNYIKYGSNKCPGYRKLNEMGVTDYKKIFEESEEE